MHKIRPLRNVSPILALERGFQEKWRCPWNKQSGTWRYFKDDGVLETSEAVLKLLRVGLLRPVKTANVWNFNGQFLVTAEGIICCNNWQKPAFCCGWIVWMVCVRWGQFLQAQLLIVSPQLQQSGVYYLVFSNLFWGLSELFWVWTLRPNAI